MQRHGSPALGAKQDSASRVQKPESAADKLAALKARVSAALDTSKAKGGLNVGLHPALADLAQNSSSRPSDSRSSSSAYKSQSQSHPSHGNQSRTSANKGKALDLSGPSMESIKSNPYYDPNIGTQGAKARQSRELIFNQKGKYIQQANALRRQAALEAMKKKIAEKTRKVGIDEDIDVEKNFLVEAPPDIEWWDEGLVQGKNYDHVDDVSHLKIETSDSIITSYIQHPVQIAAADEKLLQTIKPLYLTKTEQKKVRRQRRMADLKEEQAKIRLGLVPAPPPKVKKSNLMRVLGEEAIKDPTQVEARVNREIAERHATHVEANDDRKLTKEQRQEKLEANQQKDASKGLHMLVFKINTLANGQHRYKINVNAEQNALTGIVIMHPKQSLVIVEGGAHSIQSYKKLMLNRIDWTENAPTRDKGSQNDALRQWLKAEDEKGGLRDLSLNKCQLLFEGEVKERAFRKWGSKVTETDVEAREVLSRAKADSFWNLAKSSF